MQYKEKLQRKLRKIEQRITRSKENESKNRESVKIKRLQPKRKTVERIMDHIETTGDLRSGRVRSREGSKSREGSAVSIRDRE